MNTKRQTIWLVSMLSIMVVLSAYYLFTEPATTTKVAQNQTQTEGAKLNATEATADATGTQAAIGNVKVEQVANPEEAAGAAVVSEAASKDSKATDAKDAADAAKGAATEQTAANNASAGGKTDEQILDQLGKQGVSSKETIAGVGQQRNQEYTKQMDQLRTIINDMDKSPDEAGKAQEELTALDNREQKITSLEDELRKQFGDAVISQQDQNKYQVIVASDQLEVSEAVNIIDMLVKELNVSQDKVSVKRIAP